jgi:hypothetical protein
MKNYVHVLLCGNELEAKSNGSRNFIIEMSRPKRSVPVPSLCRHPIYYA